VQDLALDAVQKVMVKQEGTDPEIDIKKYAKVEKLPGGSLDDCR
jgi:T-complex protein 1 subunit gamma